MLEEEKKQETGKAVFIAENIVDCNPSIKAKDAKYFMTLYFDMQSDIDGQIIESTNGHGYFEFAEQGSNDRKFFGKNSAWQGIGAIDKGIILTDKEYDRKTFAEKYSENHPDEQILISKALPLTKEQYEKGIEFAKETVQNPGNYVLIGTNCINFVQDVYKEIGFTGYFTENFSKNELIAINSRLSSYISKSFPSGDIAWYEHGLSKTEVAKKHNIAIERLEELKSLPIGLRQHGIKSFKIKAQEVYLSEKAREQFKSEQVAKALEIIIAPWMAPIGLERGEIHSTLIGNRLTNTQIKDSLLSSDDIFNIIKPEITEQLAESEQRMQDMQGSIAELVNTVNLKMQKMMFDYSRQINQPSVKLARFGFSQQEIENNPDIIRFIMDNYDQFSVFYSELRQREGLAIKFSDLPRSTTMLSLIIVNSEAIRDFHGCGLIKTIKDLPSNIEDLDLLFQYDMGVVFMKENGVIESFADLKNKVPDLNDLSSFESMAAKSIAILEQENKHKLAKKIAIIVEMSKLPEEDNNDIDTEKFIEILTQKGKLDLVEYYTQEMIGTINDTNAE